MTINLTDREGTYTGQKYVMILDREEIEKIVKYMKKHSISIFKYNLNTYALYP